MMRSFVVGRRFWALFILLVEWLVSIAVPIAGFGGLNYHSTSSSPSVFFFFSGTNFVRPPYQLTAQRRRTASRFQGDSEDDYYEQQDDYYDSDGVGEEEEEDEWEEDDYWNDENRPQQTINENWKQSPPPPSTSRGGIYKVVFDPNVDPKETQLDWEVCSDENGKREALVLLPPQAVERPTAILHFVGGTFFGSLPQVWYRSLLEGLVRNTQCAIVVTPIPVTLFKSPLQHISLARQLRSALENAWETVLEDEYGDLSDIPFCGCGHSLGARLLVVLATLTQNQAPTKQPRRGNRKSTLSIPSYKSLVLISFTNYGAAAGIPGVATLLRQSKKHEMASQTTQDRSRRKTARKARQDWWVDDKDWDPYGEDDDYDDDWEELVEDLQELVKEQAARVKSALTPDSKDLEFSPSPDRLWKALEKDGRYRVPRTLIVQFDDDVIDQSSKLAQILHETQSSDVHFARLRGSHLTPISVDEGSRRGSSNQDNDGWSSSSSGEGWRGISSRATTAVWKAIKGRGKTRAQEIAMQELRQSISRYISDVVTK